MGNAFNKGLTAGAPGLIAGIASSVIGLVTLNPVLVGVGLGGIISGAVAGTVTGVAAQQLADGESDLSVEEATRQSTLSSLAKNYDNFHKGVISDMKTGAFGPEAKGHIIQFTSAMNQARSAADIVNRSGLVPGWGSARDRAMTSSINRYMTNSNGSGGSISPALANHFGDPVTRMAGTYLRGVGSTNVRNTYATMRDSRIHAMHLAVQMSTNTSAVPANSNVPVQVGEQNFSNSQPNPYGSANTTSYEGRIQSGVISQPNAVTGAGSYSVSS